MVKVLCKGSLLNEHIDSATAQKLATRAFKAVKEYAFGRRGKPRFRSKNRFSSVEGKNNQAGIRWQAGKIVWKGLELKVKLDIKDKQGLQAYALSCRTKYVRLVQRKLKGAMVWFVQLIQEGTPCYKAANAGGEVIEFNTQTTALSQSCQCGERHKKTLKERWHQCQKCGVSAQRDLYSAFLSRFVENHRLDAVQAVKAWAGAGILLEQAVSNLNQTTTSKTCLASFGLSQSQSGLPVKKGSVYHEALDVVACA